MNFLQKYGFLLMEVVILFATIYYAGYGTNVNDVKSVVDGSFYVVQAIAIGIFIAAHFLYDYVPDALYNTRWFVWVIILLPFVITVWNCSRFEAPIFK